MGSHYNIEKVRDFLYYYAGDDFWIEVFRLLRVSALRIVAIFGKV